ncbi:MAG: precorrin-6y C5,15-methyltransferase (decarboxylating) subunit CbiE, partial [Methanomassiliicoccaceae archaeon]|nr:precorrin-6y C5,15-methyltransferase (decarboxylating) subunit CbiE [Methanomassiliicoccaceae archaeon]
ETGLEMDEMLTMLSERYGIQPAQKEAQPGRSVTIVGIGMGNEDTLTVGAKKAIENADLLIGAERMVRAVSSGQDSFSEYRAEQTIAYMNEHPEYRRVAVLVSGDTGFQSAAKKMIEKLDNNEFDVDIKCGISSIAFLCSRIGSSWDDALLISAHGREANIVGAVSRNNKVIVLLGGEAGTRAMCRELAEYCLDDVTVTVGQDLGQSNEKITRGRPSELSKEEFGTLCIAMIENPRAVKENPLGINDELFIRGDAPMTKEEVRTLSVVKLKLEDGAVLFDIGAGTGSVAVESALTIPNGKVYAIEKEIKSAELIMRNKKKFRVPNLEVILGRAPGALGDLPSPTHVFIGGSSGDLKEIMAVCLKKNPKVRFVINAITLETVSEMTKCFEELDVVESEIVSVSVSKSKKAGRYHLMNALNPIYIGVCSGK